MDRMAKHTKQPELLNELFEALGNDAFLIAECLARPALAERLLTDWYAYDERIHCKLKQRAEAELQAHKSVERMKQTSGTYSEIELVRSNRSRREVSRGAGQTVELNSRHWDEAVQKLAEMFNAGAVDARPARGTAITQIRTRALSRLQQDETRYYARAVISKTDNELEIATVSWAKEPLDSWVAGAENHVDDAMVVPTAMYTLPQISDVAGCTDDTWTPTPSPPDGRYSHTAVWTGGEMIVWGGSNGGSGFNTGGRYNPATNTWIATSTTNAPSVRSGHTAVWTGSEMIVWGGSNDSSGGRYNPATNTWTATSTTNAPSARSGHTAVWTGSQMIVWGGTLDSSGGRYNPSTDSWTATSMTNTPTARYSHTAVWTGTEMIVWGVDLLLTTFM
jgi:hypothetical protein